MAFYTKKSHSIKIELAPLIDIIFILIIFFAISTTLITQQQGLKLQLPSASTAVSYKAALSISIDHKQSIYINKKKVTVTHIKTMVAAGIKANPNLKVTLQADQNTPYALLIRVMDTIRKGGCFNIILEAQKKAA